MSAPTRDRRGVTDLAGRYGPDALRDIPAGKLPDLAAQIRRFLNEKVCAAGGDLGPNLGVVDLALALHRVFDTGHQRAFRISV
ncbi:hypothetical protein OG317_36900 [Streptomyces sp. NBC_01167]|uniref:1-deoxy-D-xylulose-5-phosphate synthase N-terminal domain-containing protein n=1 Tax=Streptomyces sp. NBC_01167 TaxID=2903756 RepID=UPI00386B632F|nr:hypothetical protein OG317_36900 [Streptomyces sp. NBC_01167]